MKDKITVALEKTLEYLENMTEQEFLELAKEVEDIYSEFPDGCLWTDPVYDK